MITPEIISYIKTERAKNIPDATIKANLLANGWNEKDIAEAIATPLTSAGQTPSKTGRPITSELKRYQKKQKWITFAGGMILYFLFNSSLLGSGGTSSVILLIPGVLIMYLSAYIVTRGSEPQDKKWKEIAFIIIRIIGAEAITLLIAFAIAFAACLVSLNSHPI
jgi:hypothetical protein